MTKIEEGKSPSQNNLLVVLLIVAALAIGYLFSQVQSLKKNGGGNQPVVDNGGQQQPQRPTELKIAKPDTKKDHWRGTGNEQFVMVEYTDGECPFCKSAHPTIQQLADENKGKVGWVARHYPLSFHPKAQKSAEAMECAFEQGGNDAFWKMADTIYEKMPALELADLPATAAELGLNQAKFKTCLDTDATAQKVKDQLAEGTKAGVAATPSIVIYDMKTGKTALIEGALPYEQMKVTLDDFVKKQS